MCQCEQAIQLILNHETGLTEPPLLVAKKRVLDWKVHDSLTPKMGDDIYHLWRAPAVQAAYSRLRAPSAAAQAHFDKLAASVPTPSPATSTSSSTSSSSSSSTLPIAPAVPTVPVVNSVPVGTPSGPPAVPAVAQTAIRTPPYLQDTAAYFIEKSKEVTN
jgi:hypothetical protein